MLFVITVTAVPASLNSIVRPEQWPSDERASAMGSRLGQSCGLRRPLRWRSYALAATAAQTHSYADTAKPCAAETSATRACEREAGRETPDQSS